MSLRGKIAQRAAESVDGLRERFPSGDELREKTQVGAASAWLTDYLAALAPAPGPSTMPLDLSLSASASAASAGKLPGPVMAALRRLNELGQVYVSPNEIGFDGITIPWSSVVSVQLHDTANLIPTAALDKEIDKIRKLLPPFPGRKLLVGKMVDGLLVLLLTALEKSADNPRPLPCQVTYRNKLGQTKELSGGLFATAALTTVENLPDVIVATAQARGVATTTAMDTDGVDRAQRAQKLRAAAASVRGRIQQGSDVE